MIRNSCMTDDLLTCCVFVPPGEPCRVCLCTLQVNRARVCPCTLQVNQAMYRMLAAWSQCCGSLGDPILRKNKRSSDKLLHQNVLLDLAQVIEERGLRLLGIPALDRFHDLLVFLVDLFAAADILQGLAERPPEQVHVQLHHVDQHDVMRRLRDGEVERLVRTRMILLVRSAPSFEGGHDIGDVLLRSPLAGELDDARLEDLPRLQQLDDRRALDIVHDPVLIIDRLDRPRQIPAAARLRLDQILPLQDAEGLAQCASADAKRLCQLSLCRQQIARLQIALDDHLLDLLDHVLIHTLIFNLLDCHTWFLSNPSSKLVNWVDQFFLPRGYTEMLALSMGSRGNNHLFTTIIILLNINVEFPN